MRSTPTAASGASIHSRTGLPPNPQGTVSISAVAKNRFDTTNAELQSVCRADS